MISRREEPFVSGAVSAWSGDGSRRLGVMKRADLIKEIARVVEIPQAEAKIVLEVILDGMVRALRNGERIELRGFGIFDTHVRAQRIARNPRTGVQVNVPARRVLHFKPGKELLALVNTSVGATERQGGAVLAGDAIRAR